MTKVTKQTAQKAQQPAKAKPAAKKQAQTLTRKAWAEKYPHKCLISCDKLHKELNSRLLKLMNVTGDEWDFITNVVLKDAMLYDKKASNVGYSRYDNLSDRWKANEKQFIWETLTGLSGLIKEVKKFLPNVYWWQRKQLQLTPLQGWSVYNTIRYSIFKNIACNADDKKDGLKYISDAFDVALLHKPAVTGEQLSGDRFKQLADHKAAVLSFLETAIDLWIDECVSMGVVEKETQETPANKIPQNDPAYETFRRYIDNGGSVEQLMKGLEQ